MTHACDATFFHRLRILALAAVTALACLPVLADTAEGVAAFKARDYDKALAELKSAGERGDGEAQYYLARMYAGGYGIEEDNRKGISLYRKSAKGGYIPAQMVMAYAYYKGNGVQTNYLKAIEWYTRAAKQGNVLAQRNLGLIYQEGPDGREEISLAYVKGQIEPIERDYERAAYWFRKAAEQGDVVALTELGGLYYDGFYDGDVTEFEYRAAAYWFRQAAERGSGEAQYALYNMLVQGLGVVPDRLDAFIWARYAAEQGYPGGEQAWSHPDWWMSEVEQRQALRAVKARQWPDHPVFTDAQRQAITSVEWTRDGER